METTDPTADCALPPGTVLCGKSYDYVVRKTLGQGSFGITYLATVRMRGALGSLDANVQVAVKELFMSGLNGRSGTAVTVGSRGGLCDDYRRKFLREAGNLSRLGHEGIIKVVEDFEANATVYYVMEYLSGGSLDDYIARSGGLGEAESLALTVQIGTALAFMHSHRMLHLDLKPANVMRKENGDAVLIDFGLSKQYDAHGRPETSTTVGNGTRGYAPIEQADYQDGQDFPATMDIYALGATLFKMLTGHRPPDASYILNANFPEEELTARGVSQATRAVIKRAMSPLKKDRYQTVEEMLSAAALAGRGEGSASAGTGEEVTVVSVEKPVSSPEKEDKEKTGAVAVSGKSGDTGSAPSARKRRVWTYLLSAVGVLLGVWALCWFARFTPADSPRQAVDLGLSVKWATCNVGASLPSDYGDYFAWGETKSKLWYFFANSDTDGAGIDDMSGDSRYDAARANWGGKWRLPTKEECEELRDNCTWTWTTLNGKSGYKVTGRNGNSIFLPAAGWRYGTSLYYAGEYGLYLSSTPNESNPGSACSLYFGSGFRYVDWSCRSYGFSVRPVSE